MPKLEIVATALALVVTAGVASAATYAPMNDRDLADQADAIARVHVLASEPGPADRAPATEYIVTVNEVLRGHLPGGTVVVRVPGGIRADGLSQDVAGAPALGVGEDALLFLAAEEDGAFGILHLSLGAFLVRRAGPVRVAEQNLVGMHRLAGAPPESSRQVRDLERFASWLADRALGIDRAPDYWISAPGGPRAPMQKAYSSMPSSDGFAPRWFDFESGWSVDWIAHAAGQPGMGPTATAAAIEAALAAWTGDPTSTIDLGFAGTTTASTPFGKPDQRNTFLFGDPHDQIPGKFDCKKGGVAAMGGPYYWPSTRSYGGQLYHEIVEADVVTNDGVECYLSKDAARAAEVFAHEVGHSLGFGHATSSDALMWPTAHGDGRGARLGEDDRVGASVFYGDATYRPAPPQPPTATSFPLTGEPLHRAVRLAWSGPFAGVAAFHVESRPKSKGPFKTVAIVPGTDREVTLNELAPSRRLTLRVTAVGEDGVALARSEVVQLRPRK